MNELRTQVQLIMDNGIDRMYYLVDRDQIDNATCLYHEFREWLDESILEHDVLSFSLEK
jgi:hypothetical protein